jgi:hypothetical protein
MAGTPREFRGLRVRRREVPVPVCSGAGNAEVAAIESDLAGLEWVFGHLTGYGFFQLPPLSSIKRAPYIKTLTRTARVWAER